MKKTECKRIGNEYREVLNVIGNFIEGCPSTKDILNNDYVVEKLHELCLGLETGELEIIKFGNILGDTSVED